MKKIILLFTSIILLSCSSSDDAESSLSGSEMLIGKWKLQSTGWLVNGTEEMTVPANTPCNLQYDVEYLDTGYCQVQPCDPYATPPTISPMRSYSYTVVKENNVNKILINFDEELLIFTIKEISSQSLKTYHLVNGGLISVAIYQKV